MVDNEFKYLFRLNLERLGFSTTRKIIFHSNRVIANKITEAMYIDNCDHIVFANNEIDSDVYYTPSGNQNYIGLDWRNNQNAEVTGNIFKNFNRGIEIRSNNTNTQFTCNDFINNYHAFYLVNSPVLSDQGSSSEAADNCFLYFHSGSFPYGDNIEASMGATNNLFNWYMSPATNCNVGSPPYADCACIDFLTGVTRLGGSTAPVCTLPASFKREQYEEKYGDDLYYAPISQWKLYPNPAQEELHLEIPSYLGQAQLVITNNTGQVVLRKELKDANTRLDISNLKSGLYHLQAGDFKTTWLKE
jgi:hypothetical protein